MKTDIKKICRTAKSASRKLAILDEDVKNKVLRAMAKGLVDNAAFIERENCKDIAYAQKHGMSMVLIERLRLDPARIRSMADSLVQMSKLKDPVGETLETRKRPNGLIIKKVRVPIGVILIIYESRPNVTSDCAGLCLKSGNAVILRGGKESINSNLAIFKVLDKACARNGLPKGTITMIGDPDRAIVDELLNQSDTIDLVMPRGGESLIRNITERSRIPVIKHYKGVCHVYVDKDADLEMAEEICFNAKVQRPGVCNAMETMLVHERVARKFLPKMVKRFIASGVEIRGSKEVTRVVPDRIAAASEKDWYTEYLDMILSVKTVKSINEAIAHIMKYGSYHSDSIVTKNKRSARKFLAEVDSACVYVNASTRFTDGGEFGKGAEIGISTDKIHARGPMGVEELTSYKYVVYGKGQVRE